MNKFKLFLLSVCLMMAACNANDSISRENRCQFIFDTSLHPLPCCIIIGTSTYDFTLLAWDGQCPNCLSDYGGYNYPLTWQDNGLQLHCAKCNRSYDVNNGVVAEGAGGRQLLKYNAALDGSIIRAWN